MDDKGEKIYWAAATAFRDPDVISVTLTENRPLLIPGFDMMASIEEYPGLLNDPEYKGMKIEEALHKFIIKDLSGLESIQVTLDGRTTISGNEIGTDALSCIHDDKCSCKDREETHYGTYWVCPS